METNLVISRDVIASRVEKEPGASAPRLIRFSSHRIRGVTLLELLLALGLTTLVFVAITMAIDLHLRTIDRGRTEIEEAQLARAVLRRMADDLRGSVQYQVIDFSTLQGLSPDAAAGLGNLQSEDDLVGTALNATGGVTGASGAGGSSQGGSSTSTSSGSRGAGGAGGASGSNSSGGASRGNSSTGGAAGGSTAGGSQTGAATGDDAEATESAPAPLIPGIYGNQSELQIDVSRLPRPDEFDGVMALGIGASAAQIPSDIKTVSYYVKQADINSQSTAAMSRGGFSDEAKTGGLVRRELDRAMSQMATENRDDDMLNEMGDVIAPEITAVEFKYFDGTQWLQEWYSDEMEGLPVAVEIALVVTPQRFLDEDEDSPFAGSSEDLFRGETVYRMVVRLPAARPAPPPESEEVVEP